MPKLLASALACAALSMPAVPARAESPEAGITYQRQAEFSSIFTSYLGDYGSFFRAMFDYDATTYAEVGGATAVLLPFDQRLQAGSKNFAIRNRIMVPDEPAYRSVWKFHLLGTTTNVQFPRTIHGLTWFFGDGLFSMQLTGLFAAWGYGGGDTRAAHVTNQLIESLTITGPTVLGIKIMTGRESPEKSTRAGGHWQGYPGLIPYSKDQSKYYSFPSGHTATAVTTLTVLAENYAEQAWIRPVGDVMVGSLMFALMNAGSHWPSDFPLAILIGYTSGHTIVANDKARDSQIAREKATAQDIPVGWQWRGFTPTCRSRACGLQSEWAF